MCIEYAIAGGILLLLAFASVFLSVVNTKLEDENERLQKSISRLKEENEELWITALGYEQELAKKDSLISILKIEIEEKENKK